MIQVGDSIGLYALVRTLGRGSFGKVWLVILSLVLAPVSVRAQQVTIYRDKFGTPSVVADRLEDALYGLGYAMAQDNAEQMARNYKQARGRRAEVDGQTSLITDTFLRSLGI